MLNIAAFSFDSQLLDPFCGSGTFLCQAALMGYRHLIGSDLSPEAIEGAKKNFLWLQQKFQLSSDIDAKFFSADAREIDKIISSGTIDAIVSEPYLGPRRMLRGNEEMRNEIDMISHLYLDFFLVAKKILRNNGRIVIVLPIFVSQGKDYSLDILPQMLAQGWRQEALSDSARRSLIYFRPGQLVKREIMSFSF
jgi:tRNA G10  N-methylase Trm11